ncbi:MAG: 23S rRNA (uracil(1939)-C(5))-methyltransferase RlmD [Bacilli bacterium]|nr:23S rRNA (uracil(1939)-C(5))-methyltransferase RlmD [Bacilli bacterium]
MKKIEVKCSELNEKALGIVHLGKDSIEVPNFLPREEGIIEINNEGKFSRVKLIKITKPSSKRVEVKCDIYNNCGGCQLLHLSYNDQIEFKRELVESYFKNAGLPSKIDEIISAEKLVEYRNKMQVAYKYREGKVVCGFYEEESHRIIQLTNCLVQSPKQNEIVKYIQVLMGQMKIAPYNEDKRTGVIRFVLVREARFTKEVMVIIVTNSEMFPGRNDFIKRLKAKFDYITTIIQNVNSRKTSIILGDEERILFGKGYIEDYLCGIKFKISSKTFFQTNPYQTEKLYNKVVEYAALTGNETIIDAYCGVGTIGMVLAKNAKNVIGVESNKQSVTNASANAYENKIKNIKFYCNDATDFLMKLASEKIEVDIIIMDPPRSGSTIEFLNSIKKLKPKKVIYVSCDPATLTRDLKDLISDYKIEKKAIVDMFVGTYHVESIVCLERKK